MSLPVHRTYEPAASYLFTQDYAGWAFDVYQEWTLIADPSRLQFEYLPSLIVRFGSNNNDKFEWRTMAECPVEMCSELYDIMAARLTMLGVEF